MVDQIDQAQDAALRKTYPAVPESVPRARHEIVEVAAGAGASAGQLDAIRLAASEALTNAVLHAYDCRAGRLHVRAAVDPGGLAVSVVDDGHGMGAGTSRSVMGLGLALIAEAAQELAILKRPSGGTELQMRFGL